MSGESPNFQKVADQVLIWATVALVVILIACFILYYWLPIRTGGS